LILKVQSVAIQTRAGEGFTPLQDEVFTPLQEDLFTPTRREVYSYKMKGVSLQDECYTHEQLGLYSYRMRLCTPTKLGGTLTRWRVYYTM